MPKKAVIIGAGPAGLTAAYELLTRTDIIPTILEKTGDIGGISKTVNYKGNRIDIGGHRFFSKSDRVMDWWLNILPMERDNECDLTIMYHGESKIVGSGPNSSQQSESEQSDKVMLVRNRLSRIYFLRKFFAYPIQLSVDTLRKLGASTTLEVLFSYTLARMFPRKPEKSLEDFFINRFGNRLYHLFFKDYTEKVWGVSCTEISAEWGAQRIKGISVAKAIAHAARLLKPGKRQMAVGDIAQKDTETSLIEKFLYPKFGPGQLWEDVARQVREMGGTILLNHEVKGVILKDKEVVEIEAFDKVIGETLRMEGEYFFSTMPVQELIAGMGESVPQNVRKVAEGLQYRDFVTVGILLKKLSISNKSLSGGRQKILPDTWIYIQEKDVKVGRLQIFNNWSPYMVKDPDTIWIGMEYFTNRTEVFWKKEDDDIRRQAIVELEKMGLANEEDVLDSTVLRMEKTYPAYFGTYERFSEVREFLDEITNLFPVGRNGMHKYNNSDHSMLTSMVAVDNIAAGITDKSNLWAINTEQEYHEEKVNAFEQKAPSKPADTDFRGFLLEDGWNYTFLWIAGIAIVLQFIIFKYFYPQAGFINGDSFNYLETAYHNLAINTYPVGYSNFLRLFSVFTYSDTALVACQYLLLEFAGLFLIFTLFYFYKPRKWVKVISFIFISFNPVWLYLANYVSSDALFVSLSIVWFTVLLWLLERSGAKLILLQVGLLFFLFTIRYNALYYPVVAAIALLLTRNRWYFKITGILGSFLVIGFFIWHTSNLYQRETGVRIFSPFSGWQLANNAMYAYRFVDIAARKEAPARFKTLDDDVRHYFDTTRDLRKNPQEAFLANTFYMWDPRSPLQLYMTHRGKGVPLQARSVKTWASVAPLYEEYGKWLIKSYPREFAAYYLWPNFLKYYAPNVEFLNTYNMGRDTVARMGRIWFRYADNKVRTRTKDLKVRALDFYPILSGALNIVFLFAYLSFLFLNGFKMNRGISKALGLTGCLWMINFCFSVFASPVALRFQLFPVTVSFVFSLFLLEFVMRSAFAPKVTPNKASGTIPFSKPPTLA